MKRFSIGTSIGDAFGLIRRRPLAVFVWGLLMLAPGLGVVALMLPMMGEMFANMPAPGSEGPMSDNPFADQMFAQMMQFQLASMLLNIGQYVVMAVVYTAMFRAVLRPREASVFSLRIGMDELRVAVVGLAIGIGLYMALMVIMLFGFALGVAMWSGDSGVAALVFIALAVTALVGFLWALARVSLMAPASVLYRDFAFVQGWRLASGRAWPLLGMMLLTWLIIVVIEMAVVLVGVVLFMVFAAGAAPWADLAPAANPFEGIHAWLTANWYWAVLGGVALSLFYGVVLTLSTAPFASACRQLAESDAPPSADDAGSPAPIG